MARRVDSFRGLAQASRLRVLGVVLEEPGLALTDIAERTGLHENTLRDHVRVLEDQGFLDSELEHRGTRGRPRRLYRVVSPETSHPLAQRRIEIAKQHGDLLRRMVGDESALDEESLHQLDALYEHLDDVGLTPDLDERKLTVTLVPCPFHELVDENREVVCQVHEALIRNVLERAGGPIALDRLLPYTTTHTCRVVLTQEQNGDAGRR